MGVLLFLADALLVLGATMRATRLIVADDLGLWYVRNPAYRWAQRHEPKGDGHRARLVTGLDCPFCVGFWVGVVVLVTLALAGGPGEGTWAWWRWVAGAFTLNEVAAHLGARLGDTSEE